MLGFYKDTFENRVKRNAELGVESTEAIQELSFDEKTQKIQEMKDRLRNIDEDKDGKISDSERGKILALYNEMESIEEDAANGLKGAIESMFEKGITINDVTSIASVQAIATKLGYPSLNGLNGIDNFPIIISREGEGYGVYSTKGLTSNLLGKIDKSGNYDEGNLGGSFGVQAEWNDDQLDVASIERALDVNIKSQLISNIDEIKGININNLSIAQLNGYSIEAKKVLKAITPYTLRKGAENFVFKNGARDIALLLPNIEKRVDFLEKKQIKDNLASVDANSVARDATLQGNVDTAVSNSVARDATLQRNVDAIDITTKKAIEQINTTLGKLNGKVLSLEGVASRLLEAVTLLEKSDIRQDTAIKKVKSELSTAQGKLTSLKNDQDAIEVDIGALEHAGVEFQFDIQELDKRISRIQTSIVKGTQTAEQLSATESQPSKIDAMNNEPVVINDVELTDANRLEQLQLVLKDYRLLEKQGMVDANMKSLAAPLIRVGYSATFQQIKAAYDAVTQLQKSPVEPKSVDLTSESMEARKLTIFDKYNSVKGDTITELKAMIEELGNGSEITDIKLNEIEAALDAYIAKDNEVIKTSQVTTPKQVSPIDRMNAVLDIKGDALVALYNEIKESDNFMTKTIGSYVDNNGKTQEIQLKGSSDQQIYMELDDSKGLFRFDIDVDVKGENIDAAGLEAIKKDLVAKYAEYINTLIEKALNGLSTDAFVIYKEFAEKVQEGEGAISNKTIGTYVNKNGDIKNIILFKQGDDIFVELDGSYAYNDMNVKITGEMTNTSLAAATQTLIEKYAFTHANEGIADSSKNKDAAIKYAENGSYTVYEKVALEGNNVEVQLYTENEVLKVKIATTLSDDVKDSEVTRDVPLNSDGSINKVELDKQIALLKGVYSGLELTRREEAFTGTLDAGAFDKYSEVASGKNAGYAIGEYVKSDGSKGTIDIKQGDNDRMSLILDRTFFGRNGTTMDFPKVTTLAELEAQKEELLAEYNKQQKSIKEKK